MCPHCGHKMHGWDKCPEKLQAQFLNYIENGVRVMQVIPYTCPCTPVVLEGS